MLDLIPRAEGAELDNGQFDETFDVVVVGYGFAGGVAAIEAADHKAKVLICEKMPLAGGLSICSGGAVRCATDAADAFAYLKASNAGKTPDEVLKVLADGMVNAKAYVEQLVACVEGAALKPTEFSGKGGGNPTLDGKPSITHKLMCRRLLTAQSIFRKSGHVPVRAGLACFGSSIPMSETEVLTCELARRSSG